MRRPNHYDGAMTVTGMVRKRQAKADGLLKLDRLLLVIQGFAGDAELLVFTPFAFGITWSTPAGRDFVEAGNTPELGSAISPHNVEPSCSISDILLFPFCMQDARLQGISG